MPKQRSKASKVTVIAPDGNHTVRTAYDRFQLLAVLNGNTPKMTRTKNGRASTGRPRKIF